MEPLKLAWKCKLETRKKTNKIKVKSDKIWKKALQLRVEADELLKESTEYFANGINGNKL